MNWSIELCRDLNMIVQTFVINMELSCYQISNCAMTISPFSSLTSIVLHITTNGLRDIKELQTEEAQPYIPLYNFYGCWLSGWTGVSGPAESRHAFPPLISETGIVHFFFISEPIL